MKIEGKKGVNNHRIKDIETLKVIQSTSLIFEVLPASEKPWGVVVFLPFFFFFNRIEVVIFRNPVIKIRKLVTFLLQAILVVRLTLDNLIIK